MALRSARWRYEKRGLDVIDCHCLEHMVHTVDNQVLHRLLESQRKVLSLFSVHLMTSEDEICSFQTRWIIDQQQDDNNKVSKYIYYYRISFKLKDIFLYSPSRRAGALMVQWSLLALFVSGFTFVMFLLMGDAKLRRHVPELFRVDFCRPSLS